MTLQSSDIKYYFWGDGVSMFSKPKMKRSLRKQHYAWLAWRSVKSTRSELSIPILPRSEQPAASIPKPSMAGLEALQNYFDVLEITYRLGGQDYVDWRNYRSFAQTIHTLKEESIMV